VLKIVGVIGLVLLAACTSGPSPDDASYLKELEAFRAQRDKDFSELPECSPQVDGDCSPVPPAQRKAILPLRYFPPDSNSSVPASLQLSDSRPTFEMPTSTGALRRMQRVGVLQFTLQGQPFTLGAFVEDGTQQISELFVPFADVTNGQDTYPAGRYLDLRPTPTGLYTIDFNRAYNPYCAYSKGYECPFPPPSNRMKVAIRAGEKAPPGE
jgi:uncharacterized protein (DUF1684 family)